jgi:hypothetical protein
MPTEPLGSIRNTLLSDEWLFTENVSVLFVAVHRKPVQPSKCRNSIAAGEYYTCLPFAPQRAALLQRQRTCGPASAVGIQLRQGR